jgi:hypothetical protein
MKSIQSIEEDAFQLPKSYDNSITFLNFIEKSFKDYLEIIEKIDEGSIVEKLESIKSKIHNLCEELIESYRQLYLGFVSKSYFHFDRGMQQIEKYLVSEHDARHPLSENKLLFRGRQSDRDLDRDGMFHLPFQLRHKATTQRFSIPGLPCLYLANSTYVCWEELDRPEYNNFYISRFEIKDYMKLNALDISLTPKSLATLINKTSYILEDGIDGYDSMILDYIIKWPLIFCCSIKVLNTDATFKPEYIIPQYLLDWVRQNKRLNAIKYFSVKTHLNQDNDYSKFVNIVFPVQEIKDTGYCSHLSSSFAYTNPRCFADIEITSEIAKEDYENYIMNFHPETSLLLSELKGFDKGYTQSHFGRFEMNACVDEVNQ